MKQKNKYYRVVVVALLAALFVSTTGAAKAQISSFQAGDLDSSFGIGGKLVISNVSAPTEMILQPDGKILILTSSPSTAGDLTILRLLPNGNPDSSFGNNGRVTADVGGGDDSPRDMVLQPDGKIVLLSSSKEGTISGSGFIRLNADGSKDSNFGTNGYTFIPEAGAAALAQLQDGRFIVAGGILLWDNQTWGKCVDPAGYDMGFFLARLDANGQFDSNFGCSGLKMDLFLEAEGHYGVNLVDALVQPDGKILISGSWEGVDFSQWMVRRFTPDGNLDVVGTGGADRCIDCGASGYRMALRPDGKIMLAISEDPTELESYHYFGVVRLNSNLSTDTGFGTNGVVLTTFNQPGWDGATDVAVGADNKTVTVGHVYLQDDMPVVRYKWDGSLDSKFGQAGIIMTDLGGGESSSLVEIQPDGKILVAGQSDGKLALTRYLGAPLKKIWLPTIVR